MRASKPPALLIAKISGIDYADYHPFLIAVIVFIIGVIRIFRAFMSDRPYVENGEDEERYIEGQVLIDKGTDIGGVNDLPDNIGFLGYLNATLPEEKIKERMDYFRDQAKQLMELRKSGHLPDNET